MTLNPSNTVTAIQQGGSTVTSVLAGSSVTDQATVTGSAGTPTGTVTFTFFTSANCTTGGTVGTPQPLNGSGVATSASSGPLTAGSYSYQATYNGEAGIYSPSTGACEPLTVTLNPSNTVTTIMQGGLGVTSVLSGSSVTDQATVTGSAGTPTGTVTFTFFTSANCTTGGTVGTPMALTAGVANSASSGPLTAGSYSYQATYNGEAGVYAPSTGACEPLTVTLNPSNTVTAIQQGGSTVTSVAAGSSVTDQATVTGSAGTPTGTVTFTFFTSANCTTGGTVGTPQALNGSGVATSASSGALTAGSYSYQATYNGEAGVYSPSTGACEPLTVTLNPSNTVTSIMQGGSTVTSVAAGSSVTDQATVTGSAGTPTGTVTFTFFTSANCTTGGTVGTPMALTAGVANSASSGPLAAGSYSYQATYNGEAGVYSPSTGACEPLTVTLNPSNTVTSIMQGGSTVTSVVAGSSVTDQATVTGSAGTPTGTVTFTFFTSANCTTGGTVGTPMALTAGVANSASSGPLAAGSYSYQATYNGEAGVYSPSTGACEPLTVTLNPSNTVTAIQQGGSTVTSVAAGSSVTDQATVTGSAGTPTGTVTFTFFTSANCTTGGTVGTPQALNGSGVATSASSGPLTAGSYSYQATYNGEAGVYSPSTGACEPLTVSKTPSSTVTTVQQAGVNITGPLSAPAIVTDQAIVSGTGAGTPTGSVTFTFYSAANCGGTGVTGSAVTLVAGVANSAPTASLGAGSYGFIAHYGGDANYLSSNGTCEPFTVVAPGTSNFTPGYWKNHSKATTPLLPLMLGNFNVTTFDTASEIMSEMGCGSQGVENCMAGMLLATELNLAQGGAVIPCVTSAVSQANALLVKYNYNGPHSTPSPKLTAADSAAMMSLHDMLSNYSQDGVATHC